MGYAKTRKLNLLALTKLLECNQKWIFVHLQDLMTVWTDVVNEIDSEHDSNECVPSMVPYLALLLISNMFRHRDLIYWNEEDALAIPHLQRLTQLNNDDPVVAADTRQWIKHYLLHAQNNSGGAENFANEWLVNIDSPILTDFAKLGLV